MDACNVLAGCVLERLSELRKHTRINTTSKTTISRTQPERGIKNVVKLREEHTFYRNFSF